MNGVVELFTPSETMIENEYENISHFEREQKYDMKYEIWKYEQKYEIWNMKIWRAWTKIWNMKHQHKNASP